MAKLIPLYHSLWTVPTIPTDILWILAGVFALIGVLFFAFIFYTRDKQKAFAKKVADRRAILAPMISSFLFYDEQQGKEEMGQYISMKLQVREMLKDKVNRQVFSEILLDLQKDLSGDIHERLLHLYKDFGLHKDAIRRLKSRRWNVISRAILELTEMQVRSAYTAIRPLVNHRKSVVRRKAQIAAVSLDKDGISYFLDSSRYEIAEWQQIVLIDLLRQFENYTPPRFRLWLTSSNKDVVLFSLRLIRYYKQTDAARAICQLLRHKNKQIKMEALGCIKEFGVQDALPVLQEVFWNNQPELRIAILDAINYLGDEDQLPFLNKVLEKENDFLVRNKAIGGINTIQPDTILPTKDINPAQVDGVSASPHDSGDETVQETIPVEEAETDPGINSIDETTEQPMDQENTIEPAEMPVQILDNLSTESIQETRPLTDDEIEAINQMVSEQEFAGTLTDARKEMIDKDIDEAQADALMYMQGIYEILGDDVLPSADSSDVLNNWTEEEIALLERISYQKFVEAEEQPASESATPVPEAANSEADEEKTSSAEDSGNPEWEVEFSSMHYGIFEDLYEKADYDSKFILLQQLPEVGEERDLLFLHSLEVTDKRMARQIEVAKEQLSLRLQGAKTFDEATAGAQPTEDLPIEFGFEPDFPSASTPKEKKQDTNELNSNFAGWIQGMVGKWYG